MFVISKKKPVLMTANPASYSKNPLFNIDEIRNTSFCHFINQKTLIL